ncbi:lipid-A-disaccharide kinase [Algoriphagus ratkowskyi]|uniref:Tetraacyldisaccharide 4'-kinase n=1 Tax=Algoriphagus ratkowskyi TaxID=57028 RepID=A0A2W7RRZ0_9BACT|nr:tetraacyldisaccharide 4'-kinase [Algoriphagus ratkowskyi]PZX61300.1 lipid-A-disaccharide kinase [Algoriphagus ratkowskyi]TXD79408.1 tetraacyldisaccharide 4'-kinase [Algoriphagus ratkowskyi]
MSRYAFLLYPFALLYHLVTWIRNWFFELDWLKSVPSPIPSIVVGNLSVGGTGKTPMVEFLIRMLCKEKRIAVLSRGYGRKTKGFLEANPQISPDEIGDEPFQIYQKFGQDISVYVGENRVAALQEIAAKTDFAELVILDDAFQHRYVKGDLNILLTTYQKPFFSDYLLPMGRLREGRAGAKRADVIIVTKCPDVLDRVEKDSVTNEVRAYSHANTPVLFSSISYGIPIPLEEINTFSRKIILLTGLANDQSLVNYVAENYELLEVLRYADHHDYVEADFERIRAKVKQHGAQNPVVLTTEKDAVKVKSYAPKGFLKEIPIFALPIEVNFSTDDELTLAQLIQHKAFKKADI